VHRFDGITGERKRRERDGQRKRGMEGMMDFSVDRIFGGLETCDGME